MMLDGKESLEQLLMEALFRPKIRACSSTVGKSTEKAP